MSEEQLETQIGKLLVLRGWTVSAAESCTGGLILHRLTNTPGSSRYVMGGFVTYSNEAKMQFAHVQESTLTAFGAVSEQTAGEMARGVRLAFGTTLAVASTGIAGPTGATPTKPVGTTYIALSVDDYLLVKRYQWTGDRESNKAQSAQAALDMLHTYLSTH